MLLFVAVITSWQHRVNLRLPSSVSFSLVDNLTRVTFQRIQYNLKKTLWRGKWASVYETYSSTHKESVLTQLLLLACPGKIAE